LLTVEFHDDCTAVTVLDEQGEYDDILLIQDGTSVVLRQYVEDEEEYHLIVISPQQFQSLIAAQDLPAGTYKVQ